MYVAVMTIISQFSIPVVPIHEKSTFINLGTPWLLEKVRALEMPTIQGDRASGDEGQSSRGKTLRKKDQPGGSGGNETARCCRESPGQWRKCDG